MLIAQLSDLHVRPVGELYRGVADSNRTFADAIRYLHALDRRPDLVLISGDLVDEGRPDEYAMVRTLLRDLTIPHLVMPGNHDSRDNFQAAFADHAYLPATGPLHYCIDDYPVRIVAVDSCVPGRDYGHLDAEGLRWLREVLASDRAKPTVVFLHHPPFVSGIPYLDDYRFVEDEPLREVIAEASNVEAVLCGHVHRAMLRRWAGTVVAACPSTATEIALRLRRDATPQSYLGPCACLLHLWAPGRGLVTHVSYIGEYPGPFPFF